MYGQLQPGGFGLVGGAYPVISAGWDGRGTPGRFLKAGLGGHGEGLRRSRDDAAGVQPGADPVNRRSVNVGTVHVAFRGHRPARTDGRGLARRLLKGVCGAEPR